MNPSSYSQLALESKIRDYAESLRGFVLYHGDELCIIKRLDIRIPTGTSHLIDPETIKDIASDKNIEIIIGEF